MSVIAEKENIFVNLVEMDSSGIDFSEPSQPRPVPVVPDSQEQSVGKNYKKTMSTTSETSAVSEVSEVAEEEETKTRNILETIEKKTP